MSMIRCSADQHFYDPEKHDSCPYCRSRDDVDKTVGKDPYGSQSDSGMDSPAFDDETSATMAMDDPGGTVPLDDSTVTRFHRPDPGGETVGIFKKTAGYEPVVGWLVCTSGDQKGRDYRIKPGVNEIGRDPESAVSIALGGADTAISRQWHAVIEYFNEENEFYINRKNNPEVWRNDSRVLTLTKLEPFDRLLFGSTPYIFIPLCSEKFKWALDEESSS